MEQRAADRTGRHHPSPYAGGGDHGTGVRGRSERLQGDHAFREFTLANAARLHTRNNPDFFRGTVVEQAVADELGLTTRGSIAHT